MEKIMGKIVVMPSLDWLQSETLICLEKKKVWKKNSMMKLIFFFRNSISNWPYVSEPSELD